MTPYKLYSDQTPLWHFPLLPDPWIQPIGDQGRYGSSERPMRMTIVRRGLAAMRCRNISIQHLLPTDYITAPGQMRTHCPRPRLLS